MTGRMEMSFSRHSIFGNGVPFGSSPQHITLSVTKQQMGSYLRVKFFIISVQGQGSRQESETFDIDNLATVSFIFTSNSNQVTSHICVNKHDSAKDPIRVKINCQEPSYTREWTCIDNIDNNSKQIGVLKCHSSCGNVGQFLLEAIICVSRIESLFVKLYEDNDFTDCQLSADDGGSIPVHRACLAVHSEVFKVMLRGKWTETATGQIKVEGANLETLIHLKQYMYLGTLPESGLRPLLLIAMFYLMENLKKLCIMKLAEQVTAEDLYSLLEFAFENKIPELTFAILLAMPDSVVQDAQQIMNKADKQIKDTSGTELVNNDSA